MSSKTRNINYYIFIFLCVLTSIAVSRGKCGGDEGAVCLSVQQFKIYNYSWSNFTLNSSLDGWFTHRLFWFFMQSGYSYILDVISKAIPFLKNDMVREWAMSYLQVGVIFFALVISFNYLFQRSKSISVSLSVLLLIWVGSYGISFLTGGFIENTLCLLLVIRLFYTDSSFNLLSKFDPFSIAVLDFLMVSIKTYSIIFCLITLTELIIKMPPSVRKSFISKYFTVFLSLLSMWFYFKHSVNFGHLEFYTDQMENSGNIMFVTAISNLFKALFSFSYGILWTFPLIALPIMFRSIFKKAIYKYTAIIFLFMFFGFFPFWHGANGIAGNRLIFPFLLSLIPEISDCLFILYQKNKKRFICAMLFLIILFFPTINYRHNLIVSNYLLPPSQVTPSTVNYNTLPYWQPQFYPPFFAWGVLLTKINGNQIFRIRLNNEQINVLSKQIFPMTGLSRMIFLSTESSGELNDKYSKKLPNPEKIKFLCVSLISIWILWISAVYFKDTKLKIGDT
ncbi:MAG: hypothetical protein HQM15_00350 [Deltaproteobacteria bacterium]|nr:hypothetical protein [Deltaproteobacteria bacterium]